MNSNPSHPNCQTPAPDKPRQMWRIASAVVVLLCLLSILGAYAWLQTINFHAGYGETDVSAYIWQAKRFARFEAPAVNADNPFQFQEHMWVETPEELVTSKYAPGLSLAMALPWRLMGDVGPFLVSPVAGCLALLGAFLLFRLWMDMWTSLCATAATAASSFYLIYTGYPLAHGLEVALTIWGMWLLFTWMRSQTQLTGLLAGSCLGFAVLVRHMAIFFVLCVAEEMLFALWDARRQGRRLEWVSFAALAAGYSVFPIALASWNTCLFGLPWRTGYSLSLEQDAFSWGTLLDRIQELPPLVSQSASPVLLALGFFGLWCVGDASRRTLRLLWAVPPLLLYSAYYWPTQNASFTRFLISVWPLWVGCAFALLAAMPAGRLTRSSAVGLLLLFCVWHQTPDLRKACHGQLMDGLTQKPAAASAELDACLPDNTVLFTIGLPYHCVEVRRDWQVYDLNCFTLGRLNSFEESNTNPKRVEARRQPERTSRFKEFYSTTTEAGLRQWQTTLMNQALADGRPVWFALPQQRVMAEWKRLPRNLKAIRQGSINAGDKVLFLYEIVLRPTSEGQFPSMDICSIATPQAILF